MRIILHTCEMVIGYWSIFRLSEDSELGDFSYALNLYKLYEEQAKTEKGFRRICELFLMVTNRQSHCCNCWCCSFAFLKIILKNFVLFDFRGHENVTLTFSWNLVPNAGILHRIKAEDTFSFSFPGTYVRS